MNITLIIILLVAALSYIVFCAIFYFTQERYVFSTSKLDKGYSYPFHQPYEELFIRANDGKQLNGLLFPARNSRGLIFFLHGNDKAMDYWGHFARFYTNRGYDIFMFDYRGFGKSEGEIESQQQLLGDVQTAYDEMKKLYDESETLIMGYSLGTAPAAWLASANRPAGLILMAPYFDYVRLIQRVCPIIPRFIVKYKLETHKYLRNCAAPVALFHGDKDKVIEYEHSVQLSRLLKEEDSFITLHGEEHFDLMSNPQYRQELIRLVSSYEPQAV